MLHPKGMRRIFDKEKSNIFSNDFANGKIATIMGLATLSQRLRKGGFSTKDSGYVSVNFSPQALHLCPLACLAKEAPFLFVLICRSIL